METVSVQILDLEPRHARFHGGFRDCARHPADPARIERHRNDVVRTIDRPRTAIGGRDLVWHVLAGKFGDRMGCGDLHFRVDRQGAHVERAAEDIGKAQYVIHLVRIVAAAGRDDRVRAHGLGVLGRAFRIGIGHGEDDRCLAHALDHVLRHGAGDGEPEKHVAVLHRVFERSGLGFNRVRGFPLIHSLGPAAIDDPLGVAQDRIGIRQAHRLQEFQTRDAGRACAVHHDLDVGKLATGQMHRVDDAGGGDDGGAVLVIMENRNVHHLAQAFFDDETVRRLDVLQIDAAEARAEIAHRADELFHVRRADFEVDGIHIRETLEEDGLAFHHRFGGERAEITQAEDRGAIGNHGHEIALGGVVISKIGVVGDGAYRRRHARRVGQRQVTLRRHRLGRRDLELAGLRMGVECERLILRKRGPIDVGHVSPLEPIHRISLFAGLSFNGLGVSRDAAC